MKETGIKYQQLQDNPMVLKGKTAKLSRKRLKKKARKLGVSKVITFKQKGVGKLTFKKVSGSKRVSINAKTGTVTVKKKTKKGTLKVRVKVMAAGTNSVASTGWKYVNFKIKVK